MSFATLEEAWGVPALVPAAQERAPPARTNEPRHQRPVQRAPLSPKAPLRIDDDADVHNAQRMLANAYARFGIAGIARLLPPEAAQSLSLYQGRRRRGGGWWRRVCRAMARPETMLFLLLCVFVAFVLWDSFSAPPAAMPTSFSMAGLSSTM